MSKLSFLDLNHADVSLTSISSVERWWKRGNKNEYPEGRTENILSYTIHGNKEIYGNTAQEIKPTVYKVLPIAEVEEAHDIPYRGENIDKVVLKVL